MKKVAVLIIMLFVIAMASSALAADVVYKLTCDTCLSPDQVPYGTSGVVGYWAPFVGDVYDSTDTLVGHYYATVRLYSPYVRSSGNQAFMTLNMVELASGGPPWYNFTVTGTYGWGTGIGYGAITNITEYAGSLTGAYWTMAYNAAPAYYFTLTLHLP